MMNCELFLSELEGLPSGAAESAMLAQLPLSAREHAAVCASCEAAVRDFVETRRALGGMQESLPEAGPWFTRRVMREIAAQEQALEETQDGFWASVRRLAPRMVAFASLLLMLGGTWAFEERRAAQAHGPEVRPVEGIFETTPSVPANDDVIESTNSVEGQSR
jgi:hypothetical protein